MPKSKSKTGYGNGSRTKPVMPAVASREGKVEAAPINRPGKLLTIIAMLRCPEGATIEELVNATGWKPNSVRGAISGDIRKRRLMKVVTEVANGVRTYRIRG